MKSTTKMYILLLLSILIVSCSHNDSNNVINSEIKIYVDDTIRYSSEFINSKKGRCDKFYHDNGILKEIKCYNNELIQEQSFFNEKGELEVKFHYNLVGDVIKKELFNNNKIIEVRNFINVSFMDEPFWNTWVVYNEKGNVDFKKSHFYNIRNLKTEYKKDSIYELEIEYYPLNNDGYVLLSGKINKDFSYDESEVKRINFTPPIVKFSLNTSSLGENNIRFIIEDYNVLDNSDLSIKYVFIEVKYLVVK